MRMSVDVNAWKRITEKQKKKVQTTATVYVQQQAVKIFKYVLKQTPQQTGSLAYNWRMAVGRDYIANFGKFYRPNPGWPVGKTPYVDFNRSESGWSVDKSKYEKPRYAGHPEAMREPVRLALMDEVPRIRWNSRIVLINDTPYAYELTQPGNTMGNDEPFEFRDANIQRTNKGMLDDGQWRIMTAVKMRFRI